MTSRRLLAFGLSVLLILGGALLVLTSPRDAKRSFEVASNLPYWEQEGTLTTAAGFWTLVTADRTAYVLDGLEPDRGVHIFDVSRKSAPVRVAHLRMDEGEVDPGTSIAHAAGNLMVQTPDHGLVVLDVRDPGRPSLVTRIPSPGDSWGGTAVAGARNHIFAFYADRETGIWKGLLRHYRLEGGGVLQVEETSFEGQPMKAAFRNEVLVALLWFDYDVYGLAAWHLGGGGRLTPIGVEPLADDFFPALGVTDEFIVAGGSQIALFRPTPSGLDRLGSVELPTIQIEAFAELDDILVAATRFDGLLAFEVSDPTNVVTLGLTYDSSQEPFRWMRADYDVASIGTALVVTSFQGLLTLQWRLEYPESGYTWLAALLLGAGGILAVATLVSVRRFSR